MLSTREVNEKQSVWESVCINYLEEKSSNYISNCWFHFPLVRSTSPRIQTNEKWSYAAPNSSQATTTPINITLPCALCCCCFSFSFTFTCPLCFIIAELRSQVSALSFLFVSNFAVFACQLSCLCLPRLIISSPSQVDGDFFSFSYSIHLSEGCGVRGRRQTSHLVR